MSYTFKNIYTKPNAEVNINFWDEDGSKASAVNDLIDTYFDAGKITQKPTKSVDGLTETWTAVFKDKVSFDEFSNESASKSNLTNMSTYCTDNGIIFNMVEE